MDGMDLTNALTISDALEMLRGKKISARELAEGCYRQIERLNPKLNAFITVTDLQDALNVQFSDDRSSFVNRLGGIPIAVKDLFDTAGIRTTIGSKFFAENTPEQDAF